MRFTTKLTPIAACAGCPGEPNEHKMHWARFGAGSGTGLRRAGKHFRLRGRIDSPIPPSLGRSGRPSKLGGGAQGDVAAAFLPRVLLLSAWRTAAIGNCVCGLWGDSVSSSFWKPDAHLPFR